MEPQQANNSLNASSVAQSVNSSVSDWTRYGIPILVGFCVLVLFFLVQLAVFVLPENRLWKRFTGYRKVGEDDDRSEYMRKQKNSLHCHLKRLRSNSLECGGNGHGGTADPVPGDTPPVAGNRTLVPLVLPLGTPPAFHSQKRLAVREETTERVVHYNNTLRKNGQENLAFDREITIIPGQAKNMNTDWGSPTNLAPVRAKRDRPVARVQPVQFNSDDEMDNDHKGLYHLPENSIVVDVDVHNSKYQDKTHKYRQPAVCDDTSITDPDDSPRYQEFKEMLFPDDIRSEKASERALRAPSTSDLQLSSMELYDMTCNTDSGYTPNLLFSSVNNLNKYREDVFTCTRPLESHTNNAFESSQEYIHALHEGRAIEI